MRKVFKNKRERERERERDRERERQRETEYCHNSDGLPRSKVLSYSKLIDRQFIPEYTGIHLVPFTQY
jgi:hypothetical protein